MAATSMLDAPIGECTTRASAGALARRLQAARARTLMLSAGLDGERRLGPRLSIVNPPLWEFGHLAWFQERWCLRWQAADRYAAAARPDADALYDSAAVAHDTRWDLPLPDWGATRGYLAATLERTLERMAREPDNETLRYFAELAAAHEEMHCEAFTYTRQTLGYPAPVAAGAGPGPAETAGHDDVDICGGEFRLGAPRDGAFVFDNEKWAHPVALKPFRIARHAVTQAEFAAFVDDGGYRARDCWSGDGWRWRGDAGATGPAYWRKEDGQWQQRVFDGWQPLADEAAMIHVNWFEAEAWCRWARRRLPSEAEWEQAAATAPSDPAGRAKRTTPWGAREADADRANLYGAAGGVTNVSAYEAGDSAWGVRQLFGNVWEWTADAFQPYPGFTRDPYREYSAPWFGDHKVLRGGCWATAPALLRTTWRNFYTPDRRDVFAGFRTCAC
jgi:iron(II)-dependent oxidoreductase